MPYLPVEPQPIASTNPPSSFVLTLAIQLSGISASIHPIDNSVQPEVQAA